MYLKLSVYLFCTGFRLGNVTNGYVDCSRLIVFVSVPLNTNVARHVQNVLTTFYNAISQHTVVTNVYRTPYHSAESNGKPDAFKPNHIHNVYVRDVIAVKKKKILKLNRLRYVVAVLKNLKLPLNELRVRKIVYELFYNYSVNHRLSILYEKNYERFARTKQQFANATTFRTTSVARRTRSFSYRPNGGVQHDGQINIPRRFSFLTTALFRRRVARTHYRTGDG